MTHRMKLYHLPPPEISGAATISGLTGIVGTFFFKDCLDLPAEFPAMPGFGGGLLVEVKKTHFDACSGFSVWRQMFKTPVQAAPIEETVVYPGGAERFRCSEGDGKELLQPTRSAQPHLCSPKERGLLVGT
jgi:hypothetical protein